MSCRHKLALLLPALALALGCQEEEVTHEPSPPKALFLAADLTVDGATALDKDTIEFEMNNSEDFYATSKTPSALALQSFDTCVDEAFAALKGRADEANFTIKKTIDLKDCAAYEFSTVHTASVDYLYWVGCPDGDVSALDGKLIDKSLEPSDVCVNSPIQLLVGTHLTLDAEQPIQIPQEDGSLRLATARLVFDAAYAIQRDEGSPCKLTPAGDDVAWQDGCVNALRSSLQITEIDGVAYASSPSRSAQRLVTNGLVKSNEDTAQWYKSGAFDLAFNNWTGAVTYRGVATAPTYALTSGGVTVEGVVGQPGVDTSGVRLRGVEVLGEPRMARAVRRLAMRPMR